MKKRLLLLPVLAFGIACLASAQDLKEKDIPKTVQSAFVEKFPEAKKVQWEKEKGNFEANWGGKSEEDSSAQFTPMGKFVEIVVAITVSQLPEPIPPYVNKNYHGAKIKEAGKVTDAMGRHMFEVEIKGKDLIFDEKGVFLKED